ncbi:MAG TPA: signal recognition particle-docking protein FtsY [Polyangiaceae bacterium]|nr:signal recognition particle-docking protein FtsY [Polyangiaceae bacterium]
MTYTIIAVVVLVVVVLFVLISRRSSKGEGQTPEKPILPGPPAKPARPGAPSAPRVEAKPAEAPKEAVAATAARQSVAKQPAAVEPQAEPEPPPPPPDLSVLRKGLAKARGDGGFLGRLAHLFAGKKELDPTIADQVEEILLTSDVGVATTHAILARLRDGLSKNELASSQAVWDALRADAKRILGIGGGKVAASHKPEVIFMVGVNGVGKTTTIGKLASKFKSEGRSVLLAAGDTFRAAAVQQLEVWGKRIGCEVVKGKEGADPGAVIFDAIQKAKQAGVEVVLADTAGRLQTKTPLMDELKKIARTMQKAMDGAPHETLLVLDATNGQNAVSQAKMFQEAIPLTGIVLTKLDGTAKGGVILGITDELKIPVRYVGLGERADDLREFNADEFVEALFGASAEETAAA